MGENAIEVFENLMSLHTRTRRYFKNIVARPKYFAEESLYAIRTFFMSRNTFSNRSETEHQHAPKYGRYVIFANSLGEHDAISNDVYREAEVLRSMGVEVILATTYCNARDAHSVMDSHSALKALQSGFNLILHFGIFSKDAETVLAACNGRAFVRYHNITPPSYLKQTGFIAHQCRMGILQLKRMLSMRLDLRCVVTSEFTAGDLEAFGVARAQIRIAPPFSGIEPVAGRAVVRKDHITADGNEPAKLIFVGRIFPNKGFEYLLETMRLLYLLRGKPLTLYIVGSVVPYMVLYYAKLLKILKHLPEDCHVLIWQDINDKDLIELYERSDAFICCSLHEGFCVPILEAQSRGLPVLAFNTSAVGEVTGIAECLVEPGNCMALANLVSKLLNDDSEWSRISQLGIEHARKYEAEAARRAFLNSVDMFSVSDMPAGEVSR